jgi:hypothetical protein
MRIANIATDEARAVAQANRKAIVSARLPGAHN